MADGGYQGKATADDVQEQAGIPLEIVKRSDTAKGLMPELVPEEIARKSHYKLDQELRSRRSKTLAAYDPIIVRAGHTV